MPKINWKDLIWVVVVVVIALVAFYGFLISIVGSKIPFQLITVLVWPTVVVIVLIVFRKPLAYFLGGITGRVTKFSITQLFAVELSLPDASVVPFDQLVKVSQEMAFSESPNDSLINLQNTIGNDVPLGYLIVDLGAEQEWLTSRLFILTLMLKSVQGLRCVVFLGTHCNVPRSFIGIALPDDVRWALARKYPWLEETYLKVQPPTDLQTQSKQDKLTAYDAGQIIRSFLDDPQIKKNKDDRSDLGSEWICVGKDSHWEHAKRIDEACLKNDLGGALRASEKVWYEDSLDTSKVRRAQALLRRKGPFVAFINRERQFKKLIDREALLEEVAEHVEKVLDDQLPAE
jgi:hypothetical protein